MQPRLGLAVKRHTDESGGAIAEFTMIGALFLLLIGLIVQGALIFSAWLVITNAAREGARFGAPCIERPQTVGPCSPEQVEAVVRQAAAGVAGDDLDVVVESNGGLLTVRTRYLVPVVAPFADQIMPPDGMPLVAESVMRLENTSVQIVQPPPDDGNGNGNGNGNN